jgi:ribosomal protein L3
MLETKRNHFTRGPMGHGSNTTITGSIGSGTTPGRTSSWEKKCQDV